MRAQNKAPSRPARKGKLYHYLVSAELMFFCDDREGAGTHKMNLTITNDKPFVTANMIGKAQQTLQMQLFETLSDPSLKIVNVHLAGIDYLGEMSKEEFYTPPPESAEPTGEVASTPVTAAPAVVQDAFSA